jgi:hypothetical protein
MNNKKSIISNKIFRKNNRKNVSIKNRNRNNNQNSLLINSLSDDHDVSDYDIYNRLDNYIIDKYQENFDSNNENIIGRNAIVSVGSTLAATDSEEVKKINHIFLNSVKEKGVKATNQGYSGRCFVILL